uniref:FTH domain-containing protein n=1 Tax=Steinernema glaseri TaxID=37863 RepID=A0A1I7Y139_9BILA
MDAVPLLFVQRVCLLLDGDCLGLSRKISSMWGKVGMEFFEKIHTLCISVEEGEEKLYIQFEPTFSNDNRDDDTLITLDRVDLKFVTNFRIDSIAVDVEELTEITLDDLEKLIRSIRPTTEGTHPVRYDKRSCNSIWLEDFTDIDKKLISRHLPVDSLCFISDMDENAIVEPFFENAGPLYSIVCRLDCLKPRTIDVLIDKFVPVDGGIFTLIWMEPCWDRFTREHLERLVLKCERSNKKVQIRVVLASYPDASSVTNFFDFDKYYTTKRIEQGPHSALIASIEGKKLQLRVETNSGEVEWTWDDK